MHTNDIIKITGSLRILLILVFDIKKIQIEENNVTNDAGTKNDFKYSE
jgi:hypothetical protein